MIKTLVNAILLALLAQAAEKRNVIAWVTQCNGLQRGVALILDKLP